MINKEQFKALILESLAEFVEKAIKAFDVPITPDEVQQLKSFMETDPEFETWAEEGYVTMTSGDGLSEIIKRSKSNSQGSN